MYRAASEVNLGGPRATVFVLGGITYEEMAAAYEVSDAAKRSCFIGMPIHLVCNNVFVHCASVAVPRTRVLCV